MPNPMSTSLDSEPRHLLFRRLCDSHLAGMGPASHGAAPIEATVLASSGSGCLAADPHAHAPLLIWGHFGLRKLSSVGSSVAWPVLGGCTRGVRPQSCAVWFRPSPCFFLRSPMLTSAVPSCGRRCLARRSFAVLPCHLAASSSLSCRVALPSRCLGVAPSPCCRAISLSRMSLLRRAVGMPCHLAASPVAPLPCCWYAVPSCCLAHCSFAVLPCHLVASPVAPSPSCRAISFPSQICATIR